MANLGQEDDFEAAKAKALKLGATQCYIKDLRKEVTRRPLTDHDYNTTYIILITYSSLRSSASPLSLVMPSTRMSTFLALRLLAPSPPALRSL